MNLIIPAVIGVSLLLFANVGFIGFLSADFAMRGVEAYHLGPFESREHLLQIYAPEDVKHAIETIIIWVIAVLHLVLLTLPIAKRLKHHINQPGPTTRNMQRAPLLLRAAPLAALIFVSFSAGIVAGFLDTIPADIHSCCVSSNEVHQNAAVNCTHFLWSERAGEHIQAMVSYRRGLRHYKTGSSESAFQAFEQSLFHNDPHPQTHDMIAWVIATRTSKGNPMLNRAIRHAQSAVHLSGHDPYRATLAVAYAADGHFEAALEEMDLAIAWFKNNEYEFRIPELEARRALFEKREAFLCVEHPC